MNRQEAFDIAATHLVNTRFPSVYKDKNGIGTTYQQPGCSISPFIPESDNAFKWDQLGNVEEVVAKSGYHTDVNPPDYMVSDIEFFSHLQYAHDVPALVSGYDNQEWFSSWAYEMQKIAMIYELDDTVLESSKGKV